jgi:beta-1,4-N-acetylglucosaminyltransferase
MKKIFVTVGTTKFDELVELILSKKIIDFLFKNNYLLTLQYGNSSLSPESQTALLNHGNITSFKFCDSIKTYIDDSDLVISHGNCVLYLCLAGAGTILEVLREKVSLIVVINESLMDNHQAELATELENLGYLICATPFNLYECIINVLSKKRLKDFTKPSITTSSNLGTILDAMTG